MKEFINKLIGRLEEEIDIIKDEVYRDYEERIIEECAIENVIDIVNQLAEEYKNTNIITDFLQYARDNADNYDTNEGWSLADLIDLSIKYSEEYINTSTDTSSGWIACSERLPEANQKVLTCDKDGWISVNVNMPYIGVRNDFECGYYVAWQPLPAPYKEGVTENE